MAMFLELFLMGVGLAMDAFAVSICKGLGMSKVNKKQAAIIAQTASDATIAVTVGLL